MSVLLFGYEEGSKTRQALHCYRTAFTLRDQHDWVCGFGDKTRAVAVSDGVHYGFIFILYLPIFPCITKTFLCLMYQRVNHGQGQ
jgi:hypothetical protein